MGTLLSAQCQCGFKENFSQGGNKANFKTIDMEPALCKVCKIFTVENYFDKSVKCQECGDKLTFYNDVSMVNPPQFLKKPRYYGWGDFKLPIEQCLCPKCGKMTLKFIQEGFSD